MNILTTFKQRLIACCILLLIAFLLGFVPMWLNYRTCSRSLVMVERQLNIALLQNTLASSAIDARRGDYELARQNASAFYLSLQADADKEKNSSFSMAQRERIPQLFNKRDETITLIARSDPASADRLSDIYVLYREIMSR